MKSPLVRGDATREALIGAAIELFSAQGFSSVSTRELAERSGINQALIGYHFGNKEGLYLAVFEHIRDRVRERVGPVAEAARDLLDQPGNAPKSVVARRELYLPPLLDIIDAVLSMLLAPETAHWADLIVREQSRPTAAFDVLYEGFMGTLLDLLTQLLAQLRHDEEVHANAQTARLTALGVIGQLLVWRMAHHGALRHLEWPALDEEKIAAIKQSVRRNVTAQLLA